MQNYGIGIGFAIKLHTYGDDIKPSISGATAHAETTH